MSRRRGLALGVAAAATLAAAGGLLQMRAAVAQVEGVQVASRERLVAGRREGEVLIGNQVVIRVRAAAGGLTPAQRASRVADRIQSLLRGGLLQPQDVRVGTVNGEWAVVARNEVIITADTYHAALNRVTPRRLAGIWRDNLASALTAQVAGFRGEEERASSKLVPIVSLGSGVRVGAARISGPASRVAEASIVGQIETEFQDVVRIRVFVPLRSPTDIQRVPQVNVTAYGDIRL